MWVSARRLSIRRKVFSGYCPHDLHRLCEAGSFGSQVNLSLGISTQVGDPAKAGARDGQRIGRHRGWSGVPTSDKESIRWSTRFGEGSTRSEKGTRGVRILDAEKASVQRCAET